MKKTGRKFWRDDKGVAAIEFAFIVPVLSLLVIGMVDYAVYIGKAMSLQQLATTAALYVVEGGQEADVKAAVIDTAAINTAANPVTFTGEMVCECANGASVVCNGNCGDADFMRSYYSATVQATYKPILSYATFTRYFGGTTSTDGNFTISKSVSIEYERGQ
jgi:Flp pilus assembly protein TadG